MLLHHRLQELTKSFDYVIVSTAPSASLLHILVYIATDTSSTLPNWNTSVWKDRESVRMRGRVYTGVRQGLGRPAIQMLGIIPTMTRLNTQEHSLNMADLQGGRYDSFSPNAQSHCMASKYIDTSVDLLRIIRIPKRHVMLETFFAPG